MEIKTSFILVAKAALTGNPQAFSGSLSFIHTKPTTMTSNEILQADVLDILFNNRNKQYGAYQLRKNYNNRLGTALALSLSAVLLFFFFVRMDGASKISMTKNDENTLTVRTFHLPDVKQPDPIVPKQKTVPPAIKQKIFTSPVITNHPLIEHPMVDLKDLTKSLISNADVEGLEANDMPVLKQVTTSVSTVTEEVKVRSETASVEREPEFPGGQQAWLNFLRKNLMVPEELEPGDKRMVVIKFSVSAEGVVTNFRVVQSAGAAFDNEVIRVLKKMPKWKPAIQKGQAVERAFTQPVTFVAVEQ